MTRTYRNLLLSAAALCIVAVPAAFAGTTVSRCEFKAQGNLYVPGVRICSPTKITDIKIGEDGLTREIFYDDAALMTFAKARVPMSALDVSAGVCNRCDAGEDGEDQQTEVTDHDGPTNGSVDTPTDAPPTDTGGSTDSN